jgi:hypothetical protein
MKLIYWAWLLSRDERVLRLLCVACLGLAGMSYVLSKLEAAGPEVATASYEPMQFNSDTSLRY